MLNNFPSNWADEMGRKRFFRGYKLDPDATEKVCLICKISKPITDFYTDRAKRDGKGAYCKPCMIAKVNPPRESPDA